MGLKIIHIVLGKANPNRPNGVNKVVNSLAQHQADIGFDVSVWGITKKMSHNYPIRGYKTVLFQDVAKFLIDRAFRTRLKELDKETIFHIHGAFIPQFYRISRLLNRAGFEYVYTPHGAYNNVALQRSFWKKKLYAALFEKSIVKRAKCIHVLGETEVEGIFKMDFNVPYTIIPNGQGIHELKYTFHPIEKRGEIVFGFVGRIDIQTKGLDILLEGFAKYILASGRRASLWIIGDGKERENLERLTEELGIREYVKFWGSVFGEEKLNLMANMDYLCLTSRNEGMPGVVLEASGLGTPCIVSRETNMADYLRSSVAGLYLKKNTPESLALSLAEADKIKRTKQFQELKKNAVEMVRRRFDWKEISLNFIQLYET